MGAAKRRNTQVRHTERSCPGRRGGRVTWEVRPHGRCASSSGVRVSADVFRHLLEVRPSVLPYPTGAPIGAISAPNQQAAEALEPLTARPSANALPPTAPSQDAARLYDVRFATSTRVTRHRRPGTPSSKPPAE